MAKTKSRPPRLAASKRWAVSMNAVAALNSAESPLLKLAPEIRNRIYEFVLGGNSLHFYGWTSDVVVQACAISSGDGRYGRPFRHPNGEIRRRYETYGRCDVPGPNYSTSLLLVSRQINEEASLIPHATNTFILDIHNLEHFIMGLLPAQCKAITSLDLRDNINAFADPDDPVNLNASIVKQLTGLRHLKISISKANSSRPLDHIKAGLALEKLCNGRLTSVTVREQRFAMWKPRPRDELDEWREQLEVKLLSSTSWSEQKKIAAVELEKKRADRARKKAEEEIKKAQMARACAATRERRGLRTLH